MAEAVRPRLSIVLQKSDLSDVSLGTIQLPSDSIIEDAPAPFARAVEFIVNYLQQDPDLGPPP